MTLGMIDRDQLQRVLVVSNSRKPKGQELARRLIKLLKEHGIEAIDDVEGQLELQGIEADLAVSIGGDGTVLSTGRRMRGNAIPTIGINVGKLGFLAEFSELEFFDWIKTKRALKMRIVPRIYLKCTIHEGDQSIVRYAMNDATVQQGLLTRLLRIDMWVDENHAIEYRSDGLIVATPSGSTAYNLSVGGPIVSPGIDAFIVAPMAPHTLTNRPIVISGKQALEFRVRNVVQQVALVFDGHDKVDLDVDSEFRIERAEETFPLVSHGERSYFYLLRHKLGWGEQPKYYGHQAEETT